jgi:hypothetical protein
VGFFKRPMGFEKTSHKVKSAGRFSHKVK